ncbi:MAG: UDP-3-O-(3-hydroxymyristoyl)glucosamine N-acyltransferase [Candidatus Wallbacteria bacterium]|nr:UDP-3-O-(3-hydroxymyristoyl)glucosamine N-acyltransferase [Candidatus Wallbacteria bacterium]
MHERNHRGVTAMELTLKEIARRVGGRLEGPDDLVICGISSILEAGGGEMSFIVNQKFYKMIERSGAAAFLLEEGLPPLEGRPFIVCRNAYLAFIDLINLFHPREPVIPFIHPTATIEAGVHLGKGCRIGPYVVMEKNVCVGDCAWIEAHAYLGENVEVGENTHIYPLVSILRDVKIGSGVILHSGTVIGSDGFGYTKFEGRHVKIPHVGGIVLEDNVEMGANCAVDRGTVGNTVIGEGTKIDNFVQIAHNVRIGKHCLIIAQSGIAGSATVEDHVIIAAQSGVVGHLIVGKNSVVAARAVVTHCLPEGSFVSGFPAKPHHEETRIKAALKRLPEALKKLARIDREIEEKKKQ